jgi:hypothetical protein
MESKKRNFRVSRAFIIVTIVVLGLISAGYFGWSLYKDKFIRDKVSDKVYEKTNGLYTIRYDNMVLDEVAGDLNITNLTIIPDTAKYRQMVADKINPPLLLSLYIPELKIRGVKTPKALVDKKVKGSKLEINNATVVFYYAKAHPDTSANVVKQEMYQQLLGDLKEIQADTVDVTNVSLAFIDIRNNSRTIEASSISVHLEDVDIDSLHNHDSTRFFFAKKAEVKGKKGIIKNKEGTYFYHFNDFDFTKNGGFFSIESVQIEPQLSEDKYAAFSKIQKDRFGIIFKNVSLKNINLQQLIQSNVVADSLIIKKSNIKVYRDRSYPDNNLSTIGKFPQQLLMNLPITLSLKKLIIKDAYIEYKEKNPKSDYSGKVHFNNASAVISNITNDLENIKANRNCIVDFNARFLDAALTHIRLNLILNDPKGRFMYSGSLEGFEANRLNELTEPLGLAKIEKGNLNKLDFNFAGHSYGSDGKITLLYDDLKLSLLKKDSTEDKLKKKKLASFVANIIIKNSNPTRKEPVRVATVHYIHNTKKSFFNLMWKSVFAGVKQTAGM